MGCFLYVFNGYYYDLLLFIQPLEQSPKRRIWLWKFGNSYLLWNIKYVSIYFKQTLMYIQHCVLMGCLFGISCHACPNHFFFLYTLVKKSKHRLPLRYASLWRRGRKFCSSYFFVFKILEWKLPLEVECIIYHTCDFIGRCKKGWELGSRLLKDFGGALGLFLCICLKVLFKVYLAFHS